VQDLLWRRPSDQVQEKGEVAPYSFACLLIFFINTDSGHLLSFPVVTLHRLLLFHLPLKNSVKKMLVVSLYATPLALKQFKVQVKVRGSRSNVDIF